MSKFLTVSLVWLIGQALGAQTPARIKIEQRLSELLTPGSKASGDSLPHNAPPRKFVPAVEKPELPLKSASILPPAPPKPPGKTVQPRHLHEETPLVRVFNEPQPPQEIAMATTPLIRLLSVDVNEALPLPILGPAVSDRASLGDPSLEASVAAAQAKLSPARSQPAPFQAQNLPDPFENSQAVRLRNPPDELPEPPLSIRPLGR